MSDYMSLKDVALPKHNNHLSEKQLTLCLALLLTDILRGKESFHRYWFRLKVDGILEEAALSGKFEDKRAFFTEILDVWGQHEGSIGFTNSPMLGGQLWEAISNFDGGTYKLEVPSTPRVHALTPTPHSRDGPLQEKFIQKK